MIITIIIVIIAAIVATIVLIVRPFDHSKTSPDFNKTHDKDLMSISSGTSELSVKFEELAALTELEEASLVEIKDKNLLARIDNVIPGAANVAANVADAQHIQEAAKNVGQIYQAIIPKGAELAKSKDIEGAVRGIYHGEQGIRGHANLVPVEPNMGNAAAAMNVANSAMGAAAMVVGQYYMTQINNHLSDICAELNKLSAFQDREYLSKIYALIAEIQACSQFRLEIVENEELRMRELDHLKSLEHECAQLLGQANLTLTDFKKKTDIDYSEYEKLVIEAEKWYQYQQVLLKVLLNIEELTFSLYLGDVSRENCFAKFLPYARQSDEALSSVKAWHNENQEKFKIDLESNRRRRQGINGLLMNIPALFDDDLHYKDVPESTVAMIINQSSGQQVVVSEETDLFREDVRLIAKDGKMYYLPSNVSRDDQSQ